MFDERRLDYSGPTPPAHVTVIEDSGSSVEPTEQLEPAIESQRPMAHSHVGVSGQSAGNERH